MICNNGQRFKQTVRKCSLGKDLDVCRLMEVLSGYYLNLFGPYLRNWAPMNLLYVKTWTTVWQWNSWQSVAVHLQMALPWGVWLKFDCWQWERGFCWGYLSASSAAFPTWLRLFCCCILLISDWITAYVGKFDFLQYRIILSYRKP